MTNPTSETIQVLTSQEAEIAEKLKVINKEIKEVTMSLNRLKHIAGRLQDLLDTFPPLLERLEMYENDWEEESDADFPPHQDFPEDKQTGVI